MLATERDAGCWRCAAPTGHGISCAACGAPQPIAPRTDHFTVLGLPRNLAVDATDLERRYLDASRMVHPDRHQTSDARARDLALAASAAVNGAYRTLRDPVARGRYWLELHGEPLGRENNQVPPALASLVFETQEALEEFRATPGDAELARRIERTLGELSERHDALVGELEARYAAWTGTADLAELKRRLSEIAYLGTLVDDVDRAVLGEDA